MSDPAKSADEIEDVLASIRRLVSESGTPSGFGRTAPETPGKLVLTPSQRVTEPDDPWAPVPPADEAVTQDDPTVDQDSERAAEDEDDDPAWGLEDRLSDWGEIEESADEAIADAIAEGGYDERPHFEMPDEAEDVSEAEDAFDLSGLARLDGVLDEDEPGAGFEPETGDADWPGRGADSALRDLAAARFGQSGQGAAPIAPEEAVEGRYAPDEVTLPADAGAADMGAPSDAEDAENAQVLPEDDARPAAEPRMVETEAETESAERESAGPADPTLTPMFSRRIEHRAAAREGEQEMDSGLGADLEDDIDDIEDLGEEPTPFTFPDTDEGILDEETLREIVAEVVRQELQGALGQRITRNVRKMVRREIRIALAAEDLE